MPMRLTVLFVSLFSWTAGASFSRANVQKLVVHSGLAAPSKAAPRGEMACLYDLLGTPNARLLKASADRLQLSLKGAGELFLKPLDIHDFGASYKIHFFGLSNEQRIKAGVKTVDQLNEIHYSSVETAINSAFLQNPARYLSREPDFSLSFGIWKGDAIIGVISLQKSEELNKLLLGNDLAEVEQTVQVTAVIDPAFQRQGYGSKAQQVLLDFVFNKMKALVVVENLGAQQANQKFLTDLGFQQFEPASPVKTQNTFYRLDRKVFARRRLAVVPAPQPQDAL